MMLITLTILLPLVHTVAGTDCHAEPMKPVHTSTLPNQIKKLIHKDGYILWNDQTTYAVYYEGFPDLSKQQSNQFVAACVTGLEGRPFRYCVNATHINGQEGGEVITEEQFHKFYEACKTNLFPRFDDEEEDEDDFDTGKSESEEQRRELEEAAEKKD